jgi:aminobenzoyl-glutamate utilization protein B
MITVAAKSLALTTLDLLSDGQSLAAAKAEFMLRTGGGIGGSKWLAPLCDYDPPLGFRWPEYVTTRRGTDWVIPSTG